MCYIHELDVIKCREEIFSYFQKSHTNTVFKSNSLYHRQLLIILTWPTSNWPFQVFSSQNLLWQSSHGHASKALIICHFSQSGCRVTPCACVALQRMHLGAVLCHIKLSYHLQCQHHKWAQFCDQGTLLLIQLPANALGKAGKEDPSPWTPATHVRPRQNSWLMPTSGEWTNGWKNFLCFSLSLCNSAIQINCSL